MCLKLLLSDYVFSVDKVSVLKLGVIFFLIRHTFRNPYILDALSYFS